MKHSRSFVSCESTHFILDGKPYYFGGTNHHYLHYAPALEVTNALDDAVAMGLRVIRIWASIDVGSLDGPNYMKGLARKCIWEWWGDTAYDGNTEGVYFHYWDSETDQPAYNNGPNGLQRLDYVLAEAAKRDLKLTLVLINNWQHYGGIDQYAEWYGINHNDFYVDPRCRQAYKNWATHLINRVNSITGVTYRDDPTIFSWELTNEAHADGAPAEVVANWAAEMSVFIKEIDPNHLVGLGDEGFFTRPDVPAGDNWKYSGCTGMSYDAITAIPTIDYGTFHLYPDYWEESWQWAKNVWIPEHVAVANKLSKPCVLGEFGLKDRSYKHVAYHHWLDAVDRLNVAGFQFWRLVGRQADGTYPVDGEGFDVHYPSDTATLLAEWAKHLAEKR